ncbi:MAG: hypothetical protein H0T15_09405 [Thermoleophilaceae bacterium]|nr:hypothetical protein [Thermoleophilaceae bacterium]
MRTAVDCLPVSTKQAMLSGVRANSIIVGAYSSRDGGICPMLAAHRGGGRTTFDGFAKAWDRYTGAKGRARPASEREITTLVAMLEASLADSPGANTDLGIAIAEHKQLASRPTPHPAPAPERRRRHLRSWLPVFRRADAYEAAGHPLHHGSEDSSDPVRRRRTGHSPVR